MYPFPHFRYFTFGTPTIPDIYWNSYSYEERIKKLCMEYFKLVKFTDSMVDTINDQYAIIEDMQEKLPEMIDDSVIEEIQRRIDDGTFTPLLQEAIDAWLDERSAQVDANTEAIEDMQPIVNTLNDDYVMQNKTMKLVAPYYGAGISGVNDKRGSSIALVEGDKSAIFDLHNNYTAPETAQFADTYGYKAPDYVFITHYDFDHISDINSLITNGMDFSNTKFIIPPMPDWNKIYQRYGTYSVRDRALLFVNSLDSNMIQHEFASNAEYEIFDGVNVKAYNYEYDESYYETSEFEINNFSVIYKIEYGDNKIAILGDVEEAAMKINSNVISDVDILNAAHHSRNVFFASYPDNMEPLAFYGRFLSTCSPDVVFTQSTPYAYVETSPDTSVYTAYPLQVDPYHNFSMVKGVPFYNTAFEYNVVMTVAKAKGVYEVANSMKPSSNYAKGNMTIMNAINGTTSSFRSLTNLPYEVTYLHTIGVFDLDLITDPGNYYIIASQFANMTNMPEQAASGAYRLVVENFTVSTSNPYSKAGITQYLESRSRYGMTVWYRTYTGTAWNPWELASNPTKVSAMKTAIADWEDFNDFTTPCEYNGTNAATQIGSVTNSPIPDAYPSVSAPAGQWHFKVENVSAGNIIKQTITLYNEQFPTWERMALYSSGSWEWEPWQYRFGIAALNTAYSKPAKGQMAWNSSGKLVVYDGSAWVAVSA